MTEYWLQKKTIGGWSHVTSYQDEAQARRNYASCVGNGMSGYCWRLVECNVIEQAMLQEVVDVPFADAMLIEGDVKRPWGSVVQDAPKSTGWGQATPSSENIKIINPEANGELSKPDGRGAKPGSVCLMHHGLKKRCRAMPEELDMLLSQGWQRGGPRTQFEG